jgi:hypothetical protein
MVLSNPRHERFAQELAKGKSATEAYGLAGYKPSQPNAARLISNDMVAARVQELLGKAADRAEITVAIVTENLRRLALKAEDLGEAPGYSVARAAWVDAAKLNGLVTEKHEVRTGFLDEMSYVERQQFRAMLVTELERRRRSEGQREADISKFPTMPGHGTA